VPRKRPTGFGVEAQVAVQELTKRIEVISHHCICSRIQVKMDPGFAESFEKETWALFAVGVLAAILRMYVKAIQFVPNLLDYVVNSLAFLVQCCPRQTPRYAGIASR
jgi:hypothetical protein